MPNNPVLAVAEAVSDAVDVDWVSAESSAIEAGDREAVRQLRLVAGIGQAARALAARWGPFELREQIGHGSFGTVYRAWDRRLDKEIALKLLHEGAATGTEVIHEARVLATVEHPNIVPVYGADVHEGRVGIWMKFIRGKTLKDILVEQGPFGAEEAAQIGRELCRALAAVHRKGFVHRDIKAQNVMREVGGRYLLMDFGAGDTVEAARDGDIKGSPAYLAPEVVAGGAPTAQSDIYSLGVLLYHLVTGGFPIVAESWSELEQAHRRGRRTSLTDLKPDLPDWYRHAVNTALASEPSARPGTVGTLVDALEFPATRFSWRRQLRLSAALVAVVAIGIVASFEPWPTSPSVAAKYSSVAVVGFENLSVESPADDYFNTGFTEDLATQLSRVRGLRVLSGASTARYRAGGASHNEIADALHVSTVLDGTVRRLNDRVDISIRLVDAQTGVAIWSDTFESSVDNLPERQAIIVRRVAAAAIGNLSAFEFPDDSRPSPDFITLELCGRARYQARRRTEDGILQAISLYSDAIERGPRYALARAGLGETYIAAGNYGVLPRREAFSRAEAEAHQAIALDANLADAHAVLAYALKNRFDWRGAEDGFRRAITLKPSYAQAHHWYSIYLTQMARLSEAITESRTAIALDPLAIGPNLQLAAVLLMSRRYEDALAQYERTLELEPNIPSALRSMALIHTYRGDEAMADSTFARAAAATSIGAEDHELLASKAYFDATFGRAPKAIGTVSALERRFGATGEAVAASIASIYVGLGNFPLAQKWLEAAARVNDPELGYLLVDPRWDPLRATEAFQNLIKQLLLTE